MSPSGHDHCAHPQIVGETCVATFARHLHHDLTAFSELLRVFHKWCAEGHLSPKAQLKTSKSHHTGALQYPTTNLAIPFGVLKLRSTRCLRLRAAALRHRALARGEAPVAARCCWPARAPLSAARPSTTQPDTSGRAYSRAIRAPHAYTSARSSTARNRACYSSRQLRTGGRRSAGGREA